MGHKEVDPRIVRTRGAVLDAAMEELAEVGYSGFTIEGVVGRTGIAKTTIYRQWPTKSDLLLETITRFKGMPSPPDTGTLRGDLHALVSGVSTALDRDPWYRSLPSLALAADHDPQLAEAHERLISERSGALRAVLERARARGELRRGLDLDHAVAMVVGPLFFRSLFLRSNVLPATVEEYVEVLCAGIAR